MEYIITDSKLGNHEVIISCPYNGQLITQTLVCPPDSMIFFDEDTSNFFVQDAPGPNFIYLETR